MRNVVKQQSSLPLPGPLLRAAIFTHFCNCLCFQVLLKLLPHQWTVQTNCRFWVCTLAAGPDSFGHPFPTRGDNMWTVPLPPCPRLCCGGPAGVRAHWCLPIPAICIFMFNFRSSGSTVFNCSEATKSLHTSHMS